MVQELPYRHQLPQGLKPVHAFVEPDGAVKTAPFQNTDTYAVYDDYGRAAKTADALG
jgi:hypothetical protein